MGGFSFTLNGQVVPLRRYENRVFLAQIPTEIAPGSYTLDELDAAGTRVATASVTIAPTAANLMEVSPYLVRVWRRDGSVIDESNPVQAGESILLKVTGQGVVQPPLASGVAAPPGQVTVPVALVTATVGGKAAEVLSAAMSTSEAGVLETWVEVPWLADGDYTARVRVGVAETIDVPLRVAALPRKPQIYAGGIVNAASYVGTLAPGSLFSIFGSALANRVGHAGTVPLPLTLNGASVTVGGRQAPLVYVSPGQINAQVPYEVSAGTSAPVIVTVDGVSSSAVEASVIAADPGIFQYGENRAAVQNQDYSLNTETNGAAPESVAMAYLTGGGSMDPPVGTGAAAPGDPLSKPLQAVTATVNGIACEVPFSGLTPGLVGVLQVNFRVPNLPAGSYPLMVSASGVSSNSALITVR
jgi:uncharacterized protein (TIGR03437 family)